MMGRPDTGGTRTWPNRNFGEWTSAPGRIQCSNGSISALTLYLKSKNTGTLCQGMTDRRTDRVSN